MVWKRARPLVQGRVEFGDDALFPLLVRVAKLRSRLVRRVLRRDEFEVRTMISPRTHNRPIRESQYLAQFEQLDKSRHF